MSAAQSKSEAPRTYADATANPPTNPAPPPARDPPPLPPVNTADTPGTAPDPETTPKALPGKKKAIITGRTSDQRRRSSGRLAAVANAINQQVNSAGDQAPPKKKRATRKGKEKAHTPVDEDMVRYPASSNF